MDTDNVHRILDRAGELLQAGRPGESLECLETLSGQLVDADDCVEYASLKAWALSEVGQADEALDLLESELDEHPRSPRLYGALGILLSNEGDLDEACDALERAVALDPQDEVAVANLGLVCEKLREYERALALYDQAIELGGEIDWLLQRRGSVLIEIGELSEARTALKRYLSLAPDDAEQWITLGILHSDEDIHDEAFWCYRQAEQIAPDSALLRLNWGMTAIQAHRVEVARQQLRYLRRLEPNSSRPLLLEALIKEEQGDTESALQAYVDALARVRREDHVELTFALERAMDFFTRRGMVEHCERLLEQAYVANACTVELCEAYRELAGRSADRARWYSLLVEGDYRPGLHEVIDPGDAVNQPHTRFLRNYQVIAQDHDEAMALVTEFAERMGEANVVVREFVSEDAIEDAYLGIYEVERESLVLTDASLR